MAIFSTDFWKDLTGIKVKGPSEDILEHNNEFTQEALGDVVKEPPPSGNDDSSADEEEAGAQGEDSGGDGEPEEGMPGEDEGGIDDMGMGGEEDLAGGEGEGGDTGGFGGGTGDSESVLDPKIKPGKHPFKDVNGRELLASKVRELAAGIQDAVEMVSKVPKIRSVVVNDLMELADEVSRLSEIVYMVPIEDTMVRYRLCAASYETQVKNLTNQIDDIINLEEKV